VPLLDYKVLHRVHPFAGFDDALLREVAQLVAVRRFAKHETIVREGEPGESFYIIATGPVAIVRVGTDGRETILSILKTGEFFGEMSVLDTSTRSASVRTMTECELGIITRVDFLGLIDRRPEIGRLLVISLAERLRAANALIATTTAQDVRSRLASLLVNLMQNFGEPGDHGTRISLRLTNQEMALTFVQIWNGVRT